MPRCGILWLYWRDMSNQTDEIYKNNLWSVLSYQIDGTRSQSGRNSKPISCSSTALLMHHIRSVCLGTMMPQTGKAVKLITPLLRRGLKIPHYVKNTFCNLGLPYHYPKSSPHFAYVLVILWIQYLYNASDPPRKETFWNWRIFYTCIIPRRNLP